MIALAHGRAEHVARVDPTLCVSCGICAGSCAPMGVGPPGRTGRDQLDQVKRFTTDLPRERQLVVVACARGAGRVSSEASVAGARILPVDCVGSLHTSVVEYLVRAGVGGVLIVACPARDCWNREGAKWLEERLYHDREAELQERVDRRRVRVAYAGEAERGEVLAAMAAYRSEIESLDAVTPEDRIEIGVECDPVAEEALP